MSKYFKNIKSFEDLKNQFKLLARKNHPDAGGDAEIMKEINCEYDALFPIWKEHHNITEPENQTTETAENTRYQFYTEFGWKGNNHDWNRSLKEVAQIVRTYIKEKYPTYKFSVRTSYASMCQELHVDIKESPVEIYKDFEDLTQKEKNEIIRRMRYNNLFPLNSYDDNDLKTIFESIWEERGSYYKCLNKTTKDVIEDIDQFVKSYNFSDCDGMMDYFHVDFYYFGCCQDNGRDIKIVPKTAKTKNKKLKLSQTKETIQKQERLRA